MSEYRIVRGDESHRIMLQLGDHKTFIVLRSGAGLGEHSIKNQPGVEVYLNDPCVTRWDGELTAEEWAIVARYQLAGI